MTRISVNEAACNEFNSKFENNKIVSVAIFELVIQFTFNAPFELKFGLKRNNSIN